MEDKIKEAKIELVLTGIALYLFVIIGVLTGVL